MNSGIRGKDVGVVLASLLSNQNVPAAQFGISTPSAGKWIITKKC